ncbi:Uu.00g044830.m01.CDS01 [Anthostomella pinea]|uniref:Uu.00g044830.m01.CDS01 n=1 Tax=Anthostomella pinea TaxID=933095 RepID=A0AAI8YEC0_9PEZI|nr:Uu.00g044830.m01.CDS01 [Anthostomella pinea]
MTDIPSEQSSSLSPGARRRAHEMAVYCRLIVDNLQRDAEYEELGEIRSVGGVSRFEDMGRGEPCGENKGIVLFIKRIFDDADDEDDEEPALRGSDSDLWNDLREKAEEGPDGRRKKLKNGKWEVVFDYSESKRSKS